MSIYEFTMLDSNSKLVHRVVQLDPCGNIPTFLVMSQTGKMMDAISERMFRKIDFFNARSRLK